MIHTIDLKFFHDHTIAAFVVETSAGPVLIETGPQSVFENLTSELKKLGYLPEDIGHVLLTHIHFDHAGAAWAMAKAGAKVYVHPFGHKHLLNPERLYNSAKRIYGDQMEMLWGLMEPIPEEKLVAIPHLSQITVGDTTFEALHTPGHASHHIAWKLGEVIFTGDVCGCKIGGGPVVPPCPPPDINIPLWQDSLDLIESLKPEKLYLTHYGIVDDVHAHAKELRAMLHDWSQWVLNHMEKGETPEEMIPQFLQYTAQQLRAAGMDEETIARYESANPSWMSVTGLVRFWSGNPTLRP
ncbi:MAG: MBL fold metallo-hydrolase [Bacteroidia bacterium]